MEIDRMELVPNNEVYQEDKRNTKKMMLPTDAVCARCGIIFNSVYEESCVICEDDVIEDSGGSISSDISGTANGKIIKEERQIIRFINDKEDDKDSCSHIDFIMGRESVDLRILLDFHLDDLRALCEIHGCSEGGSRGKMVVNIMKRLHPNLDKRINERLVRKMIVRNRKKFRFWKDIECAISKAKKPGKIKIIDAKDCLDIVEFPKGKD